MRPILFSFGGIHLYSYGFCIALGVLLSIFLMKRRAAKEGSPGPRKCSICLLWSWCGDFSEPRIFYAVQNFSYYAAEPFKFFAVWEGGLIFYGGAISAFLGLWLTTRKKKWPFWKTLDFLVPYGALTHAFGRSDVF